MKAGRLGGFFVCAPSGRLAWEHRDWGIMPAVLESRPSGDDLASRSWTSVRDGLSRMSTLYVLLFVAYLLLEIASFYVDRYPNEGIRILGGDPSSPLLKWAYQALIAIVDAVLSYLILTISAVAMHRFILLGEVYGRALFPTSVYIRRFFISLVIISVVALTPYFVAYALARLFPQLFIVFVFTGFCINIFIFVRLTMVFPAVAIGDLQGGLHKQFSASWRQMNGQV